MQRSQLYVNVIRTVFCWGITAVLVVVALVGVAGAWVFLRLVLPLAGYAGDMAERNHQE
jgi:uncharacterized membrane protein YuzA (DUF378 family)